MKKLKLMASALCAVALCPGLASCAGSGGGAEKPMEDKVAAESNTQQEAIWHNIGYAVIDDNRPQSDPYHVS